MYKRILVAVDDTPISRLAYKEAVKLAIDQKAKLCIAYVADEFVPVGEGVAIDFKRHDGEIRKQSKLFLKKMGKLAHTDKIDIKEQLIEISEPGHHVAHAINKFANRWKADLVVLGTRGNRGLKRLILGSVADELIEITKVPVQVVRGLKKKTSKKKRRTRAKKRK